MVAVPFTVSGFQSVRPRDFSANSLVGPSVTASITIAAINGVSHIVTSFGGTLVNIAGGASILAIFLQDSIIGALYEEWISVDATVGHTDRINRTGLSVVCSTSAVVTLTFNGNNAISQQSLEVTWYDAIP